jgi:hypothetical protein
MVFQKGRKKSGGRKKGALNKATKSIKKLLNTLLPEHELAVLWRNFLQHEDPHIAFEAFRLANYYMFGRPLTLVAAAEEPPPVTIDTSGIPRGVPVSQQPVTRSVGEGQLTTDPRTSLEQRRCANPSAFGATDST